MFRGRNTAIVFFGEFCCRKGVTKLPEVKYLFVNLAVLMERILADCRVSCPVGIVCVVG